MLSCELCILAFVAHTSTTQVPVFLSLASPEIMSSFSAARSPLAGSVEDPLEASPLCSKVALADSVEDPLEAPTLCSAVATARSLWQTQSKIPSKHHLSAPRSLWQTRSKTSRSKSGQRPICGTGVPQKIATCSKAETPAPPDVNIEVRAGLAVFFQTKTQFPKAHRQC